ncbi:MAG: DUF427 domain-containing protein [Armatimonadaceae bacterium]
MPIERTEPQPGQESVWDYPRPPRLEPTEKPIRIVLNGAVIAETHRAHRVLETSHPPTYYIPKEDINWEYLRPASGGSFCEWKGGAVYFDVVVGDEVREKVGWSYPNPTPAFAPIKDAVAFYAGPMDECTVGGEQVTPQPGGFYGGWITADIVGPFKGGPGTMGW